MSTSPEGSPGRIASGSGEPENRAGQGDAREDQARTEATRGLGESSNRLAKMVEKLGGWLDVTTRRGLDETKGLIVGGARTLFDDLKGKLTSEIEAFGYIGQKLTQASTATWGLITKATGAVGRVIEERKEARAARKLEEKEIIDQAMAKSRGNKLLFDKEYDILKEKQKNEKEIEKLEKKILKEQTKLINSKSESAKKEHLEAIKHLNAEKAKLMPVDKKPKLPADRVAPADSSKEMVEVQKELVVKVDDLSSVIKENTKTISGEISESTERLNNENDRRFDESEHNSDERHREAGLWGKMNAILASLPGWLTVAAVAGLMGIAGYLVYTRWGDIVGGFNALKEDLIGVKDNIVEAFNNKVQQVVDFGNKLVEWANNLLPSFIDWWKMTMPESFGGYNDEERAARQKQIEEEQAAFKTQQEAKARQDQIEQQSREKAAADRKQQASNTAEVAERTNKETKAIADANAKAQQNKQSAPSNVQTIVQGGNSTNVHGAPNANKAKEKSPARTTAYS